MFHNNNEDINRLYLDFDGTLTKVSGEELFSSRDFLEIKSTLFLDNLTTIILQKPNFLSNYGLSNGTFEFLKDNLAKNNEIVIISRNSRAYICSILEASGLDAKLFIIYDIKDLGRCADLKGNIVSLHEEKSPSVKQIIICDDNKEDADSMFYAISAEKRKIVVYNCSKPGCFYWNRPEEIIAFQRNKNLLFKNNKDFYRLLSSDNWKIRESSSISKELTFTIIYNFDKESPNIVYNKRVTVEELQKLISNKNMMSPENNLISLDLTKIVKPNTAERSVGYHLTIQKQTEAIAQHLSVHKPTKVTLNGYLNPDIAPQAIVSQMKKLQQPAVVIYRSANKHISFRIDKTSGNKDSSYILKTYAVSYLKDNNELNTIYFNTASRTHATINDKIIGHFANHLELVPKREVIEELKNNEVIKQRYCGLIYLHSDGTILPEEKLFITNPVYASNGILIISTQTPTAAVKKGDYQSMAQSGGTGCEIERILSKTDKPFKEKWIVITGHGDIGGKEVHGAYVTPDIFSKQNTMDIHFTAEEYANILIKCGLKAGDKINILLYVCFGGRSVGGKSFAEQLAYQLALKGIVSDIIASEVEVVRFTGKYKTNIGEIPNECLRFRTRTGKDIVLFEGRPNATPIVTIKKNQFEEGLFITPFGIGGRQDVVPDEKTSVVVSVTKITNDIAPKLNA